MSESSDDEDRKRDKKSTKRRSDKPRDRSRSPITRGQCKSPKFRESRSSSRGTFDGIDLPPLQPPRPRSPQYHSCRQCRRTFDTVRELAEHEVKGHDCEILCYHCDKVSEGIVD
ncbi:hypothetical protein CRE_26788 [Caenorhabditis remanei]|uniref:C2H2-type domain-containing protein n=1 Tax=Caenorhabditis remanei TaxID=31234 RepID=E3NGA8_CAERE|nr:hypothetical protein CRE_26788 [Caenorhabditis remanei]